MTIQDEVQLRAASKHLTRMDQLCDRLAADSPGRAATRAYEVESVRAMIRKLERQIAAYSAAHPERAA
jgi:hypothetical protein